MKQAGSEVATAIEESLLLAPGTAGAGISQAQVCERDLVRQPGYHDFL